MSDPLYDSRNPNHGRTGGLRDPEPRISAATEQDYLEDNIATVAHHVGQPGAFMSVYYDGGTKLLVDPGAVLQEVSRRLSFAQAAREPDDGRREMFAKAIYEAEPYYESGEYVDGFQVSPGGALSWEEAKLRDAEFADDKLFIAITGFPYRAADAILALPQAGLIVASQPPASPVEETNYDNANSLPVAWIAFAGNGNIRLWTADEARAKDEKARGLDMRAFTLAELVALASKGGSPSSAGTSGLIAALTPFADAADWYDASQNYLNADAVIDKEVFGLGELRINVGHLRAAKKALRNSPQTPPEDRSSWAINGAHEFAERLRGEKRPAGMVEIGHRELADGDLPERLYCLAEALAVETDCETCKEAADEINRLRALPQSAWQPIDDTTPPAVRSIAASRTEDNSFGMIEFCGTLTDDIPFVVARSTAFGAFDRWMKLPRVAEWTTHSPVSRPQSGGGQ